ncbi:S9 family peptidase [Salinibacterium sp. ZJ450]|uniref:alpha/beta hydrolase family protein n=1 Tax=Salinibacterium sp. ZJ450 TaxID=2708338 RepID=UPI001422B441|nr:alpha/beta fold hydrolase [Salinibacterium sp. ZJ450]
MVRDRAPRLRPARSTRQRAILAVSLIGGGAAVFTAVSAAVSAIFVARKVITPPKKTIEDVVIYDVNLPAGTISLARTPDSVVDGTYSFWFNHNRMHVRVGEVIVRTEKTVVRRLVDVDPTGRDAAAAALVSARRGRLGAWVYLHPDDLGVAYEDVSIQTTLGPAPAWLIRAGTDTDTDTGDDTADNTDRWVIQVHGRGVRRQECLRAVPVFRAAGYTSLLISYRNDTDAPNSDDGLYALGAIEWLDVEAAIRYALDNGAREIVLMGWSMGGALVLQALSRSELSHAVRGIVLESPVVDWVTTLHYQADVLHVPPLIREAALSVISTRWSRRLTGQQEAIDFSRLDFVRRASELDKPILLLHSDDDGFVPSTASRALAASRPDIVSYWPWHTARHTRLWNFHRERWNAEITTWLERLHRAE